MDRITANMLTSLFNGEAEHRKIDVKGVEIFLDSAGAQICIKPNTPEDAANYLQHLYSSQINSLFAGKEVTNSFNAPIEVVFNGTYKDVSVNKEYYTQLLTLQFAKSNENAPSDRPQSILLLDRYYHEEKPNMLRHYHAPSVYQTIAALHRGGQLWRDVTFMPDNNNNQKPKLALVN